MTTRTPGDQDTSCSKDKVDRPYGLGISATVSEREATQEDHGPSTDNHSDNQHRNHERQRFNDRGPPRVSVVRPGPAFQPHKDCIETTSEEIMNFAGVKCVKEMKRWVDHVPTRLQIWEVKGEHLF